MRLFDVESVSEAAVEVQEARARLSTTVGELQARVAPAQLANDAIEEVKAKSVELAQGATELARQRPKAMAGALLAGGLLLVRKPLWNWIRRARGNPEGKPAVIDRKREDAKPWIERTSG